MQRVRRYEEKCDGKCPLLGRLSHLRLADPASLIVQECQFSEFKRRSHGTRKRVKIETLDRDAVVYAWYENTNYLIEIVLPAFKRS